MRTNRQLTAKASFQRGCDDWKSNPELPRKDYSHFFPKNIGFFVSTR